MADWQTAALPTGSLLSAFQINCSHFHAKPFLGQPLVVTLCMKKMQEVSASREWDSSPTNGETTKGLGRGCCVRAGLAAGANYSPTVCPTHTNIMWTESPTHSNSKEAAQV